MPSIRASIALTIAAATSVASLAGCLGKIDSTSTQARTITTGGGAEERPGQRSPPQPADPSPPAQTGATTLIGLGYPPDALTNDADHLYWSELNSVFRASKTSPVREKLFGDGTSPASAIAVDDAFVYAVDAMRGSVRAWPKAGGAVELVLPEGSGARSLAQDATDLYVGTLGDSGGIRVISKASHGSVRTLRAGERISQVALVGTTLFSAEIQADYRVRVVRSTTSGAGGELVGLSDSPPYQLVADGDAAYWTDGRGLMSTRGAAPIYAASAGGFIAAGLSIVDGNVYVTEMQGTDGKSDGALVRVPLGGGAASVVAALTIDAPPGAFRAYGVRQTSDPANIYVTAYWSSDTGSARGDTITRVPIR